MYAANFRLARAIYSKTLSPTKTKQNKDRLSPPSIVQAFQEVSPPSEQLLINTRGRTHVVSPPSVNFLSLAQGSLGRPGLRMNINAFADMWKQMSLHSSSN